MRGIETFPSLAEIDAFGACPHPVLRNLRITQAYYELSTATARKIGAAANWCTFATWASKQAGQSIRGDDLGRKIEEAFARSDAVRLAVSRIRDLGGEAATARAGGGDGRAHDADPGRDHAPPRSRFRGAFPEPLATIADRDLAEFVGGIDPTRDTLRGSGAEDWAVLPDRMHFIADLFRLYLDTPGLFRPPFTPEQLGMIADGRTPDGRL